MTSAHDGDRVEVLLVVERDGHGRVSVHVRRTGPPVDYGTVELGELQVLLEALLEASGEEGA